MITLKEYAKKKNISYEAVRKQVNRYREDLGEHLYKKNRTQYLDEEGEAFLDQKRAANPIILLEHDKDDQIEELKRQNEQMKIKIMQLQEQIISRDEKVMELQEKLLLLTAKPVPDPEKHTEEEPEAASDLAQEEVTETISQPEAEMKEEIREAEEGKNIVNQQEHQEVLNMEEHKKKKWWQFWK